MPTENEHADPELHEAFDKVMKDLEFRDKDTAGRMVWIDGRIYRLDDPEEMTEFRRLFQKDDKRA